MNLPPSRRILSGLVIGLAAALPSASALQLSEGELKVSFDSTLSFGGLYRLQNPDRGLVGPAGSATGASGAQNSVNSDDGNLNYGKGWVSQLLKGNHDLEVRYGNFGALARGYWYNDFKADETLRTPLSDQARDRTVKGAQLLDLYGRVKTEVSSTPAAARRGSSNQKVEPCPGVDPTPMVPPMSSTKRLEMARPRPVPP